MPTKTRICNATPETIWAACFTDVKWELFGAGVAETIDVSGPCAADTTFVLVMEDGSKLHCQFTNVVQHELVEYEGRAWGGLFKVTGAYALTWVLVEGKTKTEVESTCHVTGCLGCLVSLFQAKKLAAAVEEDTVNIVKLSEEAS